MKIIFLVGGIESGLNGVGDYCRILSSELIKLNHYVSIIAINDKHVIYPQSELLVIGDKKAYILRLPEKLRWSEKISLCKVMVLSTKPDWISLQFVNFSFDKKGLIFSVVRNFSKLRHLSKWHIMFHELWVGMETTTPFKLRLLGFVQKLHLQFLIRTMKPLKIHTQNIAYLMQLRRLKTKCQLLPLFSNIPKLYQKYSTFALKNGCDVTFVIFGSIHETQLLKPFLNELQLIISNFNLNVSVTFLGICGPNMKSWKQELQALNITTVEYGKQEPEAISKVLAESDFGISTTPYEIIGKSGSVAAMSNHGLPVIVISDAWKVRRLELNPKYEGIYKYDIGKLASILSGGEMGDQKINSKGIAELFLSHLDN